MAVVMWKEIDDKSFGNVVMRSKTLVDEVAQVLADRLAFVPVGDAEIAYGVVRETVEATGTARY